MNIVTRNITTREQVRTLQTSVSAAYRQGHDTGNRHGFMRGVLVGMAVGAGWLLFIVAMI